MTDTECLEEILKLEGALVRFTPRTKEDTNFFDARRAAIIEAVEHLDIAVLKKAFRIIIEDAENDEKVYFPTVPEILRACRQAQERPTKTVILCAKFEPQKHVCSTEKPKQTEALGALRALAKYEADHIMCSSGIKATCPECGRRHMVLGFFDGFELIYPGQTEGWTRNFKGHRLCEEHDEPATTKPRA